MSNVLFFGKCREFKVLSLRKGFFEVKHVSGEIEKEFKIIQGKNRKYQDEIMVYFFFIF